MINNIFVEITNHCNFNCTFCPNSIMKRPRGYMDKGLFRNVINEIAEKKLANCISFHLMGEPLLHPEVNNFMMYCKEKGLKTNLISNISLFNDANIDHALKYIDYLEISLQSFNDESFAYRNAKKFTYDEYIDLIKKIINDKFFSLSKTGISVTLIESSKNKIRNFKDNAQFLDSNKTLQVFFDSYWVDFFQRMSKEYNLEYRKPEGLRFKRLNHEFLPGVVFNTRSVTTWGNNMCGSAKNIPALRGKCNALRSQLGILWNGDVVPCCLDYDGSIILGNVYNSSLADIMNSDFSVKMKTGFKTGKLHHASCKKCKGGSNLLSWFATQAYSFVKHRNI
ncbi:MAG: radical SAM/SPASM domain-containing protein [Candidatus Anammoxibacter sp.]